MVASCTSFLLWSVVFFAAARRVPDSFGKCSCCVAVRGLMLIIVQIALVVHVRHFYCSIHINTHLSLNLAKDHRTMSIEAEQPCVSTMEINEKLEVVLTKETRVLEINTREM
jgi:hypothetical protein